MAGPDSIVLVSIDDLRYDAIGASGIDAWLEEFDALGVRETPTLDGLIESATDFTRATSTSSYTPPSHASMFTGLYPKSHGVKTFYHRYERSSPTMAELLAELGYDTRAWIENQALSMLDVTRGFDEVVCPFEVDDANLFSFVDEAISGDQRTFLFVHLFDVHKPYGYTPGGTERHEYNEGYLDRLDGLLPAPVSASGLVEAAAAEAEGTVSNYGELSDSLREYAHNWSLDYLLREKLEDEFGEDRFTHLVRLYQAGVSNFDEGRFADLLAAIRGPLRDEEHLLFVTSDHGEALCQWGSRVDLMNSFNVSEGAVRVPLVLQTDRRGLPNDVSRPVNHVDLLPTVADALDVADPDELPGESLFDTVEGGQTDRPIFHESWYYEGGVDFFGTVSEAGDGGLSEAAVRSDRYKLRVSRQETGQPEVALYDLSADPFERNDVYGEAEVGDRLEAQLEAYLADVDEDASSDFGREETEDLEERLRALGYLE